MSVLDRFSEPTRAWFRSSFREPTPAQQGAWEAISAGEHTLVVAPTGSGKTLSAFLWSLDRLATTPRDPELPRCRVLYVSPLKALAVDVERNLRSPLVGIQHAARRLGHPVPETTVAVRSGDTPPEERRAFARHGADVLITTPESLFLLLTSQARSALAGVETVVVDEVHAVAGTKRGAHLAVTLERLDALLPRPAQRIGLSATVRPVEEVARFLAGGRPVRTVQPPAAKEWDLQVQVPVADMTDPGLPSAAPGPDGQAGSAGEGTGPDREAQAEEGETGPVLPDLDGDEGELWRPPEDPAERASVWPHLERRVAQLVAAHRSTLVFANSRRLAERLTSRLNELAVEQHATVEAGHPDGAGASGAVRPPAQLMGQAGSAQGAPPVLARAHHGSVSKEHRAQIEDALKSGELPAVVATSSLELGIDMGAVDQVVQVESPPSVASGLQRVGRAGHQVGAVSRGVFLPKHRGDLVQTAVVVDRMRQGLIEALHVPATPLDVLAQQVVAMVAVEDWDVPDLLALVRRSAPFAGLSRSLLDSVLDMLTGRYPGEDFADLRPRLVWDRVADTLTARRGAQLLAVTSGGTIPDRGLFAVMLATGDGPGRRVGELDEEMVYESRVGDVFTLGTSSWRIEDITHDQVLVTPAPGQVGRLPFWKGDTLGRPAELGEAVGAFVRRVAAADPAEARERLREGGLDEWASDNLLAHLTEQREATGHLPSDDTVVVERFRDEIGDWRVVVHSPYGTPVHAPWALCLGARLRERLGTEVQAMAADDGIVLRLPDHGEEEGRALDRELAEVLVLDPAEVHDLVTAEIGGSALFASRFRECAARALLLPRRRPDRRQPLWQQRQRSAQLLEVASRYPTFPIVLEAVREVVQDVYDVGGLATLMRRIADRSVRVVTVETPTASPFARSLLLGYVAQYLYEGDSPLAERRAAALSLDPALLTELLGRGEGASLADLLDPQVVARTEAELQRLEPVESAARAPEDLLDLLRRLGPLTEQELRVRTAADAGAEVPRWLTGLAGQRQVIQVRVAGQDRWADVQDAARLRDGLGTALPVGVPATFLEPVPDPLGDLVVRWARTHGPFRAGELAARLGVGTAVVQDVARRLVAAGRLVSGRLRPETVGAADGSVGIAEQAVGAGRADQQPGPDLCDPDVLRLLRRRSLAALRQEVEPVEQRDYAAFLPQWQSLGRLYGPDGVLRAVEQLAGARLPASALESLVLPVRVPDYSPAMLDELMAAGEVLWQGHGPIPGGDGWVSLHLADHAGVTMSVPDPVEDDDLARRLLTVLQGGGAYYLGQLVGSVRAAAGGDGAGEPAATEEEVLAALWSLVWAGHVSGDTLAALRGLVSPGRGAHRSRRHRPARAGRYSRAAVGLGRPRPGRGTVSATALAPRGAPATGTGRWALLPPVEADPTVRALGTAEQLLDRYGVLTRGSVVAEEVPGGFAGVYRVLAEAEQAGRVRRGYFVEHLGAAQFGSSGAVDRLRLAGRERQEQQDREPLVLAATDPGNGYGAALPWPPRPDGDDGGHRPGRKAGALVVLAAGELLGYLERGGRTVLTWARDEEVAAAVATALAAQVRRGRLDGLTVSRIDGEPALSSGHPLAGALQEAGFHPAPQGLRLRR